MGASLNKTMIYSELNKFLSIDEVNEISNNINISINAKNIIDIKNVSHVENITFNTANEIKKSINIKIGIRLCTENKKL